jgi:hypothetical protein
MFKHHYFRRFQAYGPVNVSQLQLLELEQLLQSQHLVTISQSSIIDSVYITPSHYHRPFVRLSALCCNHRLYADTAMTGSDIDDDFDATPLPTRNTMAAAPHSSAVGRSRGNTTAFEQLQTGGGVWASPLAQTPTQVSPLACPCLAQYGATWPNNFLNTLINHRFVW